MITNRNTYTKTTLCLKQRLYFISKRFYPLSHLLNSYTRHVFRNIYALENKVCRRPNNLLNNFTYTKTYYVKGKFAKEKSIEPNINDKQEILYLPKIYSYKETFKNYIAGLSHLTEQNRKTLLLKESVIERELFLYMLAKALYSFLNTNDIGAMPPYIDTMFHELPQEFMVKNPTLFAYIRKVVTLQQHIQNVIWGPKKLPYKYLQAYCDRYSIDSSGYKNTEITMQTFVEVAALKDILSLRPSKELSQVKITLENPEALSDSFCVVRSRKHVDQNHGDFKIDLLKENTNDNTIICMDIKTYTTNGIGRRTLSLFQPTEANFAKEINAIINALKTYPDKMHKGLQELLYDINELKTSAKGKKSFKELFHDISKLIINAMFDPSFENINFSLSMPLKDDEAFTEYYNKHLKDRITKGATDADIGQEIEKLFPSNYTIPVENHKESIDYFINVIFPETDALTIRVAFLEALDL